MSMGGFTSAVLVSLPLGWCINPLQAGSVAGAVPLTVAVPRGHRRGFSAFQISVGRTCFGWALPARCLWATTIVSHQRDAEVKTIPISRKYCLAGAWAFHALNMGFHVNARIIPLGMCDGWHVCKYHLKNY